MIRDSIVLFAEGERGITEQPPKSNKVKYNDWYYEGKVLNEAWCATFVSYIYFFAGHPLPKINHATGFNYVPTLFNMAKVKKWNTVNPKPADIVIFDWNDDGNHDHTGIFINWIEVGRTFWCIEGNTSADEKGSQSNGGGVYKRKRNVRDVSMFVNLIDNDL